VHKAIFSDLEKPIAMVNQLKNIRRVRAQIFIF